VLVRLVEALDLLIGADGDDADDDSESVAVISAASPSILRGSGARAVHSDRAVAALTKAIGPSGFLPRALRCLAGQAEHRRLRRSGASALSTELSLHSAIAVRLVLSFQPSVGTLQPPVAALHQLKDAPKVVLSAADFLADDLPQHQDSDLQRFTRMLAELALVLDIVRIGVLSDASLAASLRRGGGDGAALARRALERIASVVKARRCTSETWTEALEDQNAAIDGATAAAVRVLVSSADLPNGMLDVNPMEVAKSLRDIIGGRPLAHRLAVALHRLVRRKPTRKHSILMFSEDPSAAFEKKLRRAFAHADIPKECALSAMLAMDWERQAATEREAPRGVQEIVTRNAHMALRDTALYSRVEAIAIAAHGSSAGRTLVDGLRASRDNDQMSSVGATASCGSDIASEAAVAGPKPRARPSLQTALHGLQHRLQSKLTLT